MVYPSLWPRVRINLKDMRREELSRRDLMKVAQYEVLGWRSEKATRPGRDDRRLFTLVKPQAKDLAELYRLWRDGHCLLHHFPALRTGLLSLGPSGADPPHLNPSLVSTAVRGRGAGLLL
jgi:hypothetical protein